VEYVEKGEARICKKLTRESEQRGPEIAVSGGRSGREGTMDVSHVANHSDEVLDLRLGRIHD
jgi:hypothetical protein